MASKTSSVPAIGIDLGTTYCCVGVYQNGEVHIIENQEYNGDYTTPSYVFIGPDGEEVVGSPAKKNAFRNPENTIYDAKRILGRRFKDPTLQNDMKYWPFIIQEHEGVPKIKVNNKLFYPEQISGKLLARLKSSAEKFLKLPPGTVKKAVITVPAYFNDGQRQATIDAGELAGLEVLTILNEPTAAAIAYSVKRADTKPKKILVFDLGGGTFDVAVVNMQPNKVDILGVNGDTHLGGEDFDKKIMEYCISQFKAETGLDLLEGKDSTNKKVGEKVKRNLRRLQTYCEDAKKYLASGVKTKVCVDGILNGEDLIVDITREKFEEMNGAQFKKTIDLVDATLKELKLSKNDIEDVVLVGGSTRIPKVQQLLKTYFGGKVLDQTIHPDQAVAYGAAIQAAKMGEEKSMVKSFTIEDVTPLSLGVEIVDGTLSVIIPKNTKIPTKKTRRFVTTKDEVTSIPIIIFQGADLDVAKNNEHLGTFELTGIPSNKAGVEKVEETMEIDAMGILHVSAVCISTGGSRSITVSQYKNRMSKELKRKLLADARNAS